MCYGDRRGSSTTSASNGFAVRKVSRSDACRRKRVAREGRGREALPAWRNQQWGSDVAADTLVWGRRIRRFTVVDGFAREALAIDIARPYQADERCGWNVWQPSMVFPTKSSWRTDSSGPARPFISRPGSEGGVALYRTGQADSERLRRKLPGAAVGRQPRSALVRGPGRCSAHREPSTAR